MKIKPSFMFSGEASIETKPKPIIRLASVSYTPLCSRTILPIATAGLRLENHSQAISRSPKPKRYTQKGLTDSKSSPKKKW